MPKGLTRWSILLSATLAAAACVGAPAIVTSQSAVGCSALVPQEWKQGVESADLQNDGNAVGDWVSFADAQTGRLDQANGRTRDSIGIVERCEERDRRAVKRAKRGIIGRLLGDRGGAGAGRKAGRDEHVVQAWLGGRASREAS